MTEHTSRHYERELQELKEKILLLGGTVEEMVWWFLSLEKVCKVQLIAEAAGPLRPLDPTIAAQTGAMNGTPSAALLNARPLFEWISQLEPDAFDA